MSPTVPFQGHCKWDCFIATAAADVVVAVAFNVIVFALCETMQYPVDRNNGSRVSFYLLLLMMVPSPLSRILPIARIPFLHSKVVMEHTLTYMCM